MPPKGADEVVFRPTQRFQPPLQNLRPTSSVLRLAGDAGVHLLLKEKAWANALLTYGDAAAAYFAAQ